MVLCAAAVFSEELTRQPSAMPGRTILNLNTHWLFYRGDLTHGQSESLSDSGFQPVCLPHANAIVTHRDIDMRSFWNVSWYRRHLTPSADCRGKRFLLQFQGASQVTDVFVNGTLIGSHKGAYTPFSFDITDALKPGRDNVIAVKVDSRKRRDIPPEGVTLDYMLFGGITRNVAIAITDPLHVEWVFASRDTITADRINVRCRVKNDHTVPKKFRIEFSLIDSTGTVAAAGESTGAASADSSVEIAFQSGPIASLKQWDADRPYVYTLRTRLRDDSGIIDECIERIGVRSILFSKVDGLFYLNGKPLRLRGLNRHETYPFIGRSAADRLQAKDADILKYQLGCNIVRCSHYPQSPAFLNRCDQIGLLVLEEIPGWVYVGDSSWQEIALKNIEEMVLRDRNHPSVISFGVRINESHDHHAFYERTNRLARTLDPTRPTHGVRLRDRGTESEFLEDIWTQNFLIPKGKPRLLPWLITESVGTGCQIRSWDPEAQLNQKMHRFAEVMDSVAANKYLAGQLGWCAFDYNSGYGTADRSVCYYGAADLYRIPKQSGMFLRSQAEPAAIGPMVYIAHYWKKPLKPNDVWVATNCDKVELFINGKSMGKKTPDQYPNLPHPMAVWRAAAFKPGEIRAVGYLHDTVAATNTRHTPGKPAALTIVPDDTVLVSGGDMTRVAVLLVDKYGQTVVGAKNAVELTVSGAADFMGQNLIALEDGKTAFFIKTRSDETGMVTCTARCNGLPEVHARMMVEADPQAPLRHRLIGK